MNIKLRLPWERKKSFLGRLGEVVGNGVLAGLQIVIGVGIFVGLSHGIGKIFK